MKKQMNDYWGAKMLSGVKFDFKRKFSIPPKSTISISSPKTNIEYDFHLEDSTIKSFETLPEVFPNEIENQPETKNNLIFPQYNFVEISTILKPQKHHSTQKTFQNKHPVVEIKDFERIEDPFEMAELKTIDDKKELQMLLQNQNLFKSNGNISTYNNLDNIHFPVIKSKSAIDNFTKPTECNVSTRSFRM